MLLGSVVSSLASYKTLFLVYRPLLKFNYLSDVSAATASTTGVFRWRFTLQVQISETCLLSFWLVSLFQMWWTQTISLLPVEMVNKMRSRTLWWLFHQSTIPWPTSPFTGLIQSTILEILVCWMLFATSYLTASLLFKVLISSMNEPF